MVHYWLTPRIELLPYSGDWWPLHQKWLDDPRDFSVTVGFFLLNLVYMALGIVGLWRYRDLFPTSVLLLFMVIRTLFLTTHGTIEPRYTLLCYPALLALGAAALLRRPPEAPCTTCDTKTG